MGNIVTIAKGKAVALMVNTNTRFSKMGEMPYGQRKATPAERKIQKEIAIQDELQELLNG